MTVTYELRVHSRDVVTSLGIDKHTGYDLVKYVNGVPTSIESIDLYNSGGNIKFDIKDQLVNQYIYETTGTVHGTYVNYDGNNDFIANPIWLRDTQYHSAILIGANSSSALLSFNKIKLEASILDQLSSKLNYNFDNRNCNTATTHFANKYLGGVNVYSDLSGFYVGSSALFSPLIPLTETDRTISRLSSDLNLFYSLIDSDFDINSAEAEAIAQTDGWHLKITDDNKSYIFDGDGASAISDSGGSNDSVVYLRDGHNVLHTGSGNDEIYGGKDVDSIVTGSGDSLVYTYDGNDVVNTSGSVAEDINTVYLGSGNDTYYGGVGHDLVNGGSGVNKVHLGGGSDEYVGGIGVDVVFGINI